MTDLILSAFMTPFVVPLALDAQTVGGIGGYIAAAGFAVQQLIQYLQKRREIELDEKQQDVTAVSTAVADQATTASVLMDALTALQKENERKDDKIEQLETRNSEKDAKIESLQTVVRELRAQVHILSQRLDGVDFELDDLRDNH